MLPIRLIGGRDRVQGGAVKVERVQDHVVEGKHRNFRERCLEQGSLPRLVGKAQTWLPVIVIRRTCRNESISLETRAVWSMYFATLERSGFQIIAYAVIQGEVAE